MPKKLFFEIRTTAKNWRNIARKVKKLITEAKVKINKDKIEITIVDLAHIALMDLKIHAAYFDVFKVKVPMDIGLDIDYFLDSLKRIPNSVMVTLKMYSDMILHMIIHTRFADIHKQSFTLKPETLPEPKKPNLLLPQIFKIYPKAICTVYPHLDISDYTAWITNGKQLQLIAEEIIDKKDSFSLNFGNNGNTICNYVTFEIESLNGNKKRARSLFSYDYMIEILNIIQDADDLVVKLGNDNPIEFDFAKTNKEKIVMEGAILLAPRIEEE